MKEYERYFSTKLRKKIYGNLSFMRISIKNTEISQDAPGVKELESSANDFSSIN